MKSLLKKCIYGICTSKKIDTEITFLNDVRKLLNKVRGESDYNYLDLLNFLEEVYHLAVDKEL